MTHGLAVRCLSCRWPVANVRSSGVWASPSTQVHDLPLVPQAFSGTLGAHRSAWKWSPGTGCRQGRGPGAEGESAGWDLEFSLVPSCFLSPRRPVIGTRRSITNAGRVPEQVLGERGLSCPPPGPQLRSTRRRPGGMGRTEPRAGGRCPGRGGPQVPAAALRPGSLRGPQR